MISLPTEAQSRSAPPPVAPVTPVVKSPIIAAPPSTSTSAAASLIQPNVGQGSQPRTTTPTTPTRPGAVAGRTYTVAPKDTLFGISRKFYGNDRQVEAIYQANRDVMKDRTDLRQGMTLKIPAMDAPPPAQRR